MSSGEKDEGKCLPRKRDAFLELWAFKLPNRAHFGGYNQSGFAAGSSRKPLNQLREHRF